MTVVNNYHDLKIWQKGHRLCLDIYRITQDFPKTEQFGLTNQMRRASVSVPSNIVEGFERGSNKEFKQFLIISRGSIGELQAQLEIAYDLGYVPKIDYDDLSERLVEVHKMTNRFIKTIE